MNLNPMIALFNAYMEDIIGSNYSDEILLRLLNNYSWFNDLSLDSVTKELSGILTQMGFSLSEYKKGTFTV